MTTLLEDKLIEIEQQAVSCGATGDAAREWEAAREIKLADVQECIHKRADQAALLMADPLGLILMSFRWGYEVALTKERRNAL